MIVSLLTNWNCGSAAKNESQENIKKRGNIFLITIDTIRADHLSCYGYPRKTTPFIDQLAGKGVMFQNAYAPSASTSPAHATIFTSYYPMTHKVQKNWYKLDFRFNTLAEILSKYGYYTAAFTSSWVFSPCQLDQGFNTFNEAPAKQDAITKWGKKYRDASLTFQAVKSFFDSKNFRGQNVFVWIHLFDPHRPYFPPQKYTDAISNLNDSSQMMKIWTEQHKINPSLFKSDIFMKLEHPLNHPEYYQNREAQDIMLEQLNLYDAEIMYADHTVMKLYEYFTVRGLNEKATWIITGDHGEGLGNHNWFGHALKINSEAIKIPLIINIPDSKQNTVVNHVVEHSDIFPTISDYLGIDFTGIAPGSPGASLLYDILGLGKPYPKKYSFSQREHFNKRIQWEGKAIPGYMVYEHGETYSLQNERFQYIYRSAGVNEFYNIMDDPYGIKNLIQDTGHPATKNHAAFIVAMKKFISRYKDLDLMIKKASRKEIEKIKSLGYVE